MEKIKNFVLPENTNRLYKEEAISSIALTREVAIKINELVAAYNELAEQDLQWKQTQEGIIRKGVLYMKDNLVNTLQSLYDVLQQQGFVDSRIRMHTAELTVRLQNLLSSVKEGSTTLDAELIDLRIGADMIGYLTAGDAVRGALSGGVYVGSNNYQEVLPDLNGATAFRYFLNFSTTTTELPANLPFANMPEALVVLETYKKANYKYQVLTAGGSTYTRLAGNDNWSVWSNADEGRFLTLTDSNFTTRLDDADNALLGVTYVLNFAIGSSNLPANLPFTAAPDSLMFLDTVRSGSYGYQEIKPANSRILYRRMYAGGYREWFTVYDHSVNGEPAIKISDGGSILEGIKACYEKGYKKLVVEAGTYDIIEEYKQHYGADYFDKYVDYRTTDKFDRGLWLENIEVLFSPGAKVVCHYTGTNNNVTAYFAPFSCGNNVIIDGLVLDASRCRYGIHPDFNTGTNRSYMIIRNSDLKHKQTASNEQAIGAGFGIHVDWLVENTIFRSEGTNHVFRVHNHIDGAAQSKLTIKNCYVEGPGFFRFGHYSTSTKKSPVIVTGCSYVTEPQVGFETADSVIENIELISYCNEKRSS